MMLTRIVLIRHAKPKSEGYASDEIRPLSEEGISTQRAFTKHLKGQGIVSDVIYTSPLLRAVQTAEVISAVYGDVPIIPIEQLGNFFNGEAILAEMPPPEENKTIFLVGHAPTLADFINKLCGNEVITHGLAKSSAAVVDFREQPCYGKGEFFGYFQP